MGKFYQTYLNGTHIWICNNCNVHLTNNEEIISRSFHGRHGKAYLFNSVVNIRVGPFENRQLLTGLHRVADIYCNNCGTTLGWTYEEAYEESQKYKEGKFIIEKPLMKKDSIWP